MSEHVIELTDENFSETVGTGVSMVDFYGTWCPPCKMLEPVVETLAAKYAGKAVIAKLNVDENSEAAVEQSIADIPTILFFKNGKEEKRLFGAQSEETLASVLDSLL